MIVSWPSYARVVRGLVRSLERVRLRRRGAAARRLGAQRARARRPAERASARSSCWRRSTSATRSCSSRASRSSASARIRRRPSGADGPEGSAVLLVLVDRHVPGPRDLHRGAGVQLPRRQRCATCSTRVIAGRTADERHELSPPRSRATSASACPGERRRSPLVDGVSSQVERARSSASPGRAAAARRSRRSRCCGCCPRRAATGQRELRRAGPARAAPARAAEVRGAEIAMVFQDPLTSLHPMLSIGRQLTEHVRFHEGLRQRRPTRARGRAARAGAHPRSRGRAPAFPHQFSGGMRQRIAIAIALACGPKLLIADEPTTALDVTVQAGILRPARPAAPRDGLSVMLITHDLGVMSAMADRVWSCTPAAWSSRATTREVLGAPRHPYTRALLDALPHPRRSTDRELVPIAGHAADAAPSGRRGCAFHPRCAFARRACVDATFRRSCRSATRGCSPARRPVRAGAR